MNNSNKKVTARPCKEQPGTWEIEQPNGQVNKTHYNSKEECVKKAREMAFEMGAELNILNNNPNNNKANY